MSRNRPEGCRIAPRSRPDDEAADAPALPHLYSLHEVAEALRLSLSHLRREIRLHRIAVVRLGKLIRISPAAVDDYLAKRQRTAR